jgi:hypothetical protein
MDCQSQEWIDVCVMIAILTSLVTLLATTTIVKPPYMTFIPSPCIAHDSSNFLLLICYSTTTSFGYQGNVTGVFDGMSYILSANCSS